MAKAKKKTQKSAKQKSLKSQTSQKKAKSSEAPKPRGIKDAYYSYRRRERIAGREPMSLEDFIASRKKGPKTSNGRHKPDWMIPGKREKLLWYYGSKKNLEKRLKDVEKGIQKTENRSTRSNLKNQRDMILDVLKSEE